MADDRADPIRLLCLDVDGVLTDGGIRLDDRGVERKRFHARDGVGLRIWLALGHEVALLTGRAGRAAGHRARELGIRHVIQGSTDKAADFADLLDALGLAASQAAMIGDDLPDLRVMRLAGYPIAVADAVPEVRQMAAFVTTCPGGQGAVREAVEHLLKTQGRWNEALSMFG